MFKEIEKPTSNQDFFDKVWNWMITEDNPKCADFQGSCYYRYIKDPQNIKTCVIGAFIPDELLPDNGNRSYSGGSIGVLMEERFSINHYFKDYSLELLKGFQDIHDRCPKGGWKELLTRLANRFNLTVPQ